MQSIKLFRLPGVHLLVILTIFALTANSAYAQAWSGSQEIEHGIIIEASLYAKNGAWELKGSGRKGDCVIPISKILSGNTSWSVTETCGIFKIDAHFSVSGWRGNNESVSFTFTGSGSAHGLFHMGDADGIFIVTGTDQAAVNRRKEQERNLAEQRRRERELAEQQRRQRELEEQRRRDRELAEQKRRQRELEEQRRRERELAEQQRREQDKKDQLANLSVPSSNTNASISSSSSRSINSNTPVNVVFENKTGAQVDVYWVDYKGKEVLYKKLANGRRYTQGTYATHPWRFRSGGKVLAEYVTTSRPQQFFKIGRAKTSSTVSKQIQRLRPAGNMTGAGFSDQCLHPVEVHVRSGWWIDGVQLLCRNSDGRLFQSNHRGGLGGNGHVFKLRQGETIVGISGTTHGDAGAYVYSIQIHTNQRSSPRYGEGGPQRGRRNFEFRIPAGAQFAGLHGASGAYLNALGVLIR